MTTDHRRALREICEVITFDAQEMARAERRFASEISAVIEDASRALHASLAGCEVVIKAVEVLTRGATRVAVETPEGDRALVCFDALSFSIDHATDHGMRELITLWYAYREWLGLPLVEPVLIELNKSASVNEQITTLVDELDEVMRAMAELIRELDWELVGIFLYERDDECSIPEDDPGPDDYDQFVSLVAQALKLIRSLVSAGSLQEAAEGVEQLFDIPEITEVDMMDINVSVDLQEIISLWLAEEDPLGLQLHTPERAAEKLLAWKSALFPHDSLTRISNGIAPRARGPLIESLADRAFQYQSEYDEFRSVRDTDRALDALKSLELSGAELKSLYQRRPETRLPSITAQWLIERLTASGHCELGLELADAWLVQLDREVASDERYERIRRRQREDVKRSRRQALLGLGRVEETANALLEELKAREYVDVMLLQELYEVTVSSDPDEALSEVFREGFELIASEPRDLIRWLEQCVKSDRGLHNRALIKRIEAHIMELSMEELGRSSSLDLEPISRLEGLSPRSRAHLLLGLGWRHVDRGKGKYYHLSHEAFAEARDLLIQLDARDEWERAAESVIDEHGRKYSFMGGFRSLLEE